MPLRTYTELSLREKIVQCRYMKRLHYKHFEIAYELQLPSKVITHILTHSNPFDTAEEIEARIKQDYKDL
ncbi:hypothetical protein TUMEXPCC7403_16915 [Tumidithrix helvetica PCC 7403]|uniref:hypothetical protein n=1 Tax=Tumidithrix helvetica TaxID=3457545 RepID=UPI003CB19B5F